MRALTQDELELIAGGNSSSDATTGIRETVVVTGTQTGSTGGVTSWYPSSGGGGYSDASWGLAIQVIEYVLKLGIAAEVTKAIENLAKSFHDSVSTGNQNNVSDDFAKNIQDMTKTGTISNSDGSTYTYWSNTAENLTYLDTDGDGIPNEKLSVTTDDSGTDYLLLYNGISVETLDPATGNVVENV